VVTAALLLLKERLALHSDIICCISICLGLLATCCTSPWQVQMAQRAVHMSCLTPLSMLCCIDIYAMWCGMSSVGISGPYSCQKQDHHPQKWLRSPLTARTCMDQPLQGMNYYLQPIMEPLHVTAVITVLCAGSASNFSFLVTRIHLETATRSVPRPGPPPLSLI
jgi:hypothetical protein